MFKVRALQHSVTMASAAQFAEVNLHGKSDLKSGTSCAGRCVIFVSHSSARARYLCPSLWAVPLLFLIARRALPSLSLFHSTEGVRVRNGGQRRREAVLILLMLAAAECRMLLAARAAPNNRILSTCLLFSHAPSVQWSFYMLHSCCAMLRHVTLAPRSGCLPSCFV